MTRMRRLIVVTLLAVSTRFHQTKSEESAQYLQNAIKDLRTIKEYSGLRRTDATDVQTIVTTTESMLTHAHRRVQNQQNAPPPLSLTKGELASLYEAAIAKGDTVKIKTGKKPGYVQAAIHELDASSSAHHEHKKHPDHEGDTSDGYYYYYYPVKSFLDDLSNSHEHHYSEASQHPEIVNDKPHYQYHSHTHQHNVKITKDHKEVETEKKKGLEPLFMAISGFIGMAVMFVLSVIVFPKFGIKKRTNFLGAVKKNERITNIARVALEAIEGKDCAERFACEFEKTARTFNIQDNRFVRLLKRMAPISIGKEMDRMGKFSNKRLRCTAIPCKKQQNTINNNKDEIIKRNKKLGVHKKS